MPIMDQVMSVLMPRNKRWLVEDIAYFIDQEKYPKTSPIQQNVKSVQSYVKNSLFMGLIATIGTSISIRRQAYGKLREFTYGRSFLEALTFVTISSILLYLNTLKARHDVNSIKQTLIKTNDPLLLNHLRERRIKDQGASQFQVLKDVFTKEQYTKWKEDFNIMI